jgi:hypothetical protein
LIDLSKEELDELVANKEKKDDTFGRDLQFNNVVLNPNWEQEDPADLGDEPEEEYIPDVDLDEWDSEGDGLRCSKCIGN